VIVRLALVNNSLLLATTQGASGFYKSYYLVEMILPLN